MDNKIIIPKDVKRQIDYLHLSYPDKEWSGILTYVVDKGDFTTLKDMEFRVIGIYPMDLGKSSYTEFDYNEALAHVYDIFEKDGFELEDIKTGMVHSHHNMKAYFSGTDIDELKTNSKKHNFYLSLVVNVDEDYAAKVAFPSKVDITENHNILDKNGNTISFAKRSKLSESVLDIDLGIEIEQDVSLEDWFKDRIKELKATPSRSYSYNRSNLPAQSNYYNPGSIYTPPSYGRSWNKSYQPEIPFKENPKTDEKLDSKIEDFLLELGYKVFNLKWASLRALVSTCLKEPMISGTEMFKNFNSNFDKLFEKYFQKKSSENADAEFIIIEAVDMIETCERELMHSKYPWVEDNMLDEFEMRIYEQIP